MKNNWNKNLWTKQIEEKNLFYKQIKKCNFFTKISFFSSLILIISIIIFFVEYKQENKLTEIIIAIILFFISFITWLIFITKSSILLKKINFKLWEVYLIAEIILLSFGNLFLLTKLKFMLDEIEKEEKIKQLNEIAKSKNVDVKDIPLEEQMIEKI